MVLRSTQRWVLRYALFIIDKFFCESVQESWPACVARRSSQQLMMNKNEVPSALRWTDGAKKKRAALSQKDDAKIEGHKVKIGKMTDRLVEWLVWLVIWLVFYICGCGKIIVSR